MTDKDMGLQLSIDRRSMTCLLVQHKSVVQAWTTHRSWAADSSSEIARLASGVVLVNDLWRSDE